MTKNTGFGQGLEMAAFKKGGSGPIDLMRPGNGTPWEDRGSTGAVGAYFKTMIKSLTSPGLLLDHIRRPETTGDSVSFVIVSCAMWVVGVFIYNAYWLYWVLPKPDSGFEHPPDSITNYWISALLQAALVAGGMALWLKVGPKLYRSLGATELKGANPTLIQNCFNYSMGPSILALVPVFGSALAIIWILFDLIVAGKRRLYLKNASAVINVLLIFFIAVAIAAVVYFLLLHLVWGKLIDMSGLTIREIPKPLQLPTRSE